MADQPTDPHAMVARRLEIEARMADPAVGAHERAELAAQRRAIKRDPRHFAAAYGTGRVAFTRLLSAAPTPTPGTDQARQHARRLLETYRTR